MIPKKAFDELVAGLLSIGGKKISAIILYGSVARGTAEPDSDVDIALLLNEEFTREEWNKVDCFSADMDLAYNTVFSLVDITNAHFQTWLKAMPFYQNIEKEGIVLWKAA